MPWVRSSEMEGWGWRVKQALRRLDRRLGGTTGRRIALAVSMTLLMAALVIVS